MRKGREVFTTSGTYPWSFVTQIFHSGQPSRGSNRKIFEVMTSTLPRGSFLVSNNPLSRKSWLEYLIRASKFQLFFQNNFLVSDNGEGKVFIIIFYEISDFPEPSEQFFLI
jgi:hypothetical protein